MLIVSIHYGRKQIQQVLIQLKKPRIVQAVRYLMMPLKEELENNYIKMIGYNFPKKFNLEYIVRNTCQAAASLGIPRYEIPSHRILLEFFYNLLESFTFRDKFDEHYNMLNELLEKYDKLKADIEMKVNEVVCKDSKIKEIYFSSETIRRTYTTPENFYNNLSSEFLSDFHRLQQGINLIFAWKHVGKVKLNETKEHVDESLEELNALKDKIKEEAKELKKMVENIIKNLEQEYHLTLSEVTSILYMGGTGRFIEITR